MTYSGKPVLHWYKRYALHLIVTLFFMTFTAGCQRSSDDIWNDTKTAGRHMTRGAKSLGGKQSSSKQVHTGEEFSHSRPLNRGQHDDFIAFEDDPDLKIHMNSSRLTVSAKENPGEAGSSIPGIASFKDPSQDPELSAIFEHIHFDYNSSLVKGDENSRIIQKIIRYMKSHPNVYLFIEGHCDKKGPSTYNFALGANRSNSVRNMLADEGIAQDRLFTISYGKEKLLFDEDGDDFQSLNRRCQFRVYFK
ncbi:MAG: OmpA family protein [Chlamydia sp.]